MHVINKFEYVVISFLYEMEVDFETKLAKRMSGMGCALVTSWNTYAVIYTAC